MWILTHPRRATRKTPEKRVSIDLINNFSKTPEDDVISQVACTRSSGGGYRCQIRDERPEKPPGNDRFSMSLQGTPCDDVPSAVLTFPGGQEAHLDITFRSSDSGYRNLYDSGVFL